MKAPGHAESALAVARAALDAQEFAVARNAVRPLLKEPTQRVAALMAEIEERESGDEGRAREWMARALRAPRDPAWTADGYVSDRWMPVSPVSGRLDAFQWKVPLAELGDAREVIEGDDWERAAEPPKIVTPPPELPPRVAEIAAPAESRPRRVRPRWPAQRRSRRRSRRGSKPSSRCSTCPTIRVPIPRLISIRNRSRPAARAGCGCSSRRVPCLRRFACQPRLRWLRRAQFRRFRPVPA